MPKRYAIHVSENNLDLIQILNGGGEVAIEPETTYFVFDAVVLPEDTENIEIRTEDSLYDETGKLKEDVHILM